MYMYVRIKFNHSIVWYLQVVHVFPSPPSFHPLCLAQAYLEDPVDMQSDIQLQHNTIQDLYRRRIHNDHKDLQTANVRDSEEN